MPSDIPLLGYSDKLSGRPGDVIAFKVSSHVHEDFSAKLVRVISADPNPEGPGLIEEDVAADFWGEYPSRPQPFFPGSFVRIDKSLTLAGVHALTLEAVIWPTLINGGEQTVLTVGGMALLVMPDGTLGGRLGDTRFSTDEPLRVRQWHRIRFSFDPSRKQMILAQCATGPRGD
ncbi:MAG: N,N-dimethylformamidase beta subunit family domain-containing protein, partial [Geminicoccaceae bacterium]